MQENFWITVVVAGLAFCLVNGIAGGLAAGQRARAGDGFMMGFFLGPAGVIAALAIDGRLQCPRCLGRLEGQAQTCPHCAATLEWSGETWLNGDRIPAEVRAVPVSDLPSPRKLERRSAPAEPTEDDWDRLAAALASERQAAPLR